MVGPFVGFFGGWRALSKPVAVCVVACVGDAGCRAFVMFGAAEVWVLWNGGSLKIGCNGRV